MGNSVENSMNIILSVKKKSLQELANKSVMIAVALFCSTSSLAVGGSSTADSLSTDNLSTNSLETVRADITEKEIKTDSSEHFITLLLNHDPREQRKALKAIKSDWDITAMPMALEILSYAQPSLVYRELRKLIRGTVNDKSLKEVNDWYQWLWNQSYTPTSGYSGFKAELYRRMDPKFEIYFNGRQDTARIRLDEIRWGGVIQDGIPPLRSPEMISPQQADYLEDDNIVFGIEINGDARAYPKRILAWHEMFTDTIGGVDIAGVYCTLCGAVIPFKTNLNGVKHQLGTSGFLYRSNKLMYDQATQSLWSTTRGTPVLGPLVDKGIQLEFESVVTTTWGEWLKRHPDTTVLSLNTGHRRNYGEGVAYKNYFNNDRLMFNTPFNDNRLANKREILALRFTAAPNQQLAIDTEFLARNHIYSGSIGQQKFVVFTDKSGANRVYDPEDIQFVKYDQDTQAHDANGLAWQVQEEGLVSVDGAKLLRLPYHRAFWFGWRAAYPDTRLIK